MRRNKEPDNAPSLISRKRKEKKDRINKMTEPECADTIAYIDGFYENTDVDSRIYALSKIELYTGRDIIHSVDLTILKSLVLARMDEFRSRKPVEAKTKDGE